MGLDPETGAIEWTHDARETARGTQFHGRGVVAGKMLIVAGDSAKGAATVAISVDGGDVAWSTPFDEGLVTDLVLDGGSGLVVGIEPNGNVAAIRVSDGVVAWSRTIEARQTRWRPQSPVLAGGLLIVPGVDGSIRALEPETGKDAWVNDLGVAFSTGVVSDGETAWVGSADGRIRRFALKDGSLVATSAPGGTPFGALTLTTRGVVALTTGKPASLVCHSPDLTSVAWELERDGEWSAFRPFVLGGTILVGLDTKQFCRIDAASGRLLSCDAVPGVPRSFAAGPAGELYVGTLAGSIVSIRADPTP